MYVFYPIKSLRKTSPITGERTLLDNEITHPSARYDVKLEELISLNCAVMIIDSIDDRLWLYIITILNVLYNYYFGWQDKFCMVLGVLKKFNQMLVACFSSWINMKNKNKKHSSVPLINEGFRKLKKWLAHILKSGLIILV